LEEKGVGDIGVDGNDDIGEGVYVGVDVDGNDDTGEGANVGVGVDWNDDTGVLEKFEGPPNPEPLDVDDVFFFLSNSSVRSP